MVALRAAPNGVFAPLALAVLVFLLTPTSAGYQDLGSLIAQQPEVASHWREHLIASPFGAIHAGMFNLPRPLGTGMPDPAGFRLAKFQSLDSEITGAIHPVSLRALPDPDPDPIVFPEVDRAHKGDLLVPGAGRARRSRRRKPPSIRCRPTSRRRSGRPRCRSTRPRRPPRRIRRLIPAHRPGSAMRRTCRFSRPRRIPIRPRITRRCSSAPRWQAAPA